MVSQSGSERSVLSSMNLFINLASVLVVLSLVVWITPVRALGVHEGYMNEFGDLCPHRKNNQPQTSCYQPSPTERAQWVRDLRRSAWRDACQFSTRWLWQDNTAYWLAQREALYERYRVQSARSLALQEQMQTDPKNASSLTPMLGEVQTEASRVASCMRFADAMRNNISEESVFTMLGL